MKNFHTKISLFKNKKIRKILHENEWYFSVIDVVDALVESANPRDYWFKIKTRVEQEEKIQLSTICRQLKLESSDGKQYKTDCANTEGIFQSIAKRFKAGFKIIPKTLFLQLI